MVRRPAPPLSPDFASALVEHTVLWPLVALWMVFARRLRIHHCKPIGTPLGLLIDRLWL